MIAIAPARTILARCKIIPPPGCPQPCGVQDIDPADEGKSPAATVPGGRIRLIQKLNLIVPPKVRGSGICAEISPVLPGVTASDSK